MGRLEHRCRVCGAPAIVGWPDGWYCAGAVCWESRTWGRKLRPPQPDDAPGGCPPLRCYCGWHEVYEPTHYAPELWRPQEAPQPPQTAQEARLRDRVQRARESAPGDAWDRQRVTMQSDSRRTSAAAASKALPKSGTQRRQVLDAVVDAWRRGHGGATDPELCRHLGLSANSERPRRHELLETGLVYSPGAVRAHAGNDHLVWAPTGSALVMYGLQSSE